MSTPLPDDVHMDVAQESTDLTPPIPESTGSAIGSACLGSALDGASLVEGQLDVEAQLVLLREQNLFWKPLNRNSSTWSFFKVNGDLPVNPTNPQVMRCIICHSISVGPEVLAMRTRCRKGLITYNKANGITAMKKHVEQEHPALCARYDEEVSSRLRDPLERQPTKKQAGITPGAISAYFGSADPFKKDDMGQQTFLEDLVLYVIKSFLPLRVVESIWLQRFSMRLCPRVVFPSRKSFCDVILPAMVDKTMEMYVLPALSTCVSATASFDLWMSKGAYDVFALVVNFLDANWVPKHITIGLFEATDTSGAAMAGQLHALLDKFGLRNKILCYVKDEGSNLNTLTQALKSVITCEALGLADPFQGSCFGHAMSKACQYATNDEKVCRGMKHVSLKKAQADVQKCITWPKKSGKGRQEWHKACIDAGLRPRKLSTPVKTRFASKVIMFEEALRFRQAISLCYSRQSFVLAARIPSAQTWAIAGAIVSTLSPVVSACVLNQSRGHWLLSDALNATITLSLHFMAEVGGAARQLHYASQDFDADLEELTTKMQQEVVAVLSPFLSFMTAYDAKKAHNMLALMLDPRFKGLSLVTSYVGRDEAVRVVTEYDEKTLIPLLLICYRTLNPSSSTVGVSQDVAICHNDLFQVGASEAETTIELVSRELSLFRRIQVDGQHCKDPLVWWRSQGCKFPTVALLAKQILGIVGSQIETERIFSIAGVLTALRRCRLQTDNLDKMIFVAKNWPDDPRVSCNVHPQMEDFIVAEADMVEELEEEFEDANVYEEILE